MAVSARKIPENIRVIVSFMVVCPVFGRAANGTSPSSISTGDTGASGSSANGTSPASMVTVWSPGPPEVTVIAPRLPELLLPPPEVEPEPPFPPPLPPFPPPLLLLLFPPS